MRLPVNAEIAFTHLITRKKQTLVAAMGVMIGITVFIFLNSLMRGFDRSANDSIFRTMPHIRIYKEDEISKPLQEKNEKQEYVIVNPKIANTTKNLINPEQLIRILKKQPDVVAVAPDVAVSVFYNNGESQVNGIASGVNIMEQNKMFNIESFLLDGSLRELEATQNGIILGVGIAEKLNVRLNDNITITSSKGKRKVMKIVGLYKSNNAAIDKSKSYINVAMAQQLMNERPTYVTDIFVNVKDPEKAAEYIASFQQMTGYSAEDWKKANEQILASYKIRAIMSFAISVSILLVAGFGIYNILNMIIMEKLNDIAILKAMGFPGVDVVRIFVMQAVIIGVMGVTLGLVLSTTVITLMQKVYVGGDIGYFPVQYESRYYISGIVFGLAISFAAGYIPARKAADVDPVSIFRK